MLYFKWGDGTTAESVVALQVDLQRLNMQMPLADFPGRYVRL